MFGSLKLETNPVASERVTNCDSGTVHLERRMRPDVAYIFAKTETQSPLKKTPS